MSPMRFGDYLAQLLQGRACSGRRLAGMIGIDVSLMYRWLHHAAVPKLAAPYRDMIIRALDLSPAEATLLTEAQIYSLSLPPRKRVQALAKVMTLEKRWRAADSSNHPHRDSVGAAARLPASLLRPSGVIWGRPALLEALITLLEELPPPGQHRANTVFLSFQGEQEIFEDHPDLQAKYHQALQQILQQGWHVIHLCRLDTNRHRSVLLVEGILKLIGAGRYFPYYIGQYGPLTPPYDLLVIPHRAAIISFATQNPRRPDSGLLTYHPDEIKFVHAHFDQLAFYSQPLVERHLPPDVPAAWRSAADCEDRPGGRECLKDGLSLLTEPPSWYHKDSPWLQDLGATDQLLESMITHQQRRIATFQANVVASPYRDICSKRALEQLIGRGEHPRDDRAIGFRPSQQARREQLQHLIHLLKTYEHYQLALLDTHEIASVPTAVDWSVTGASRVFMIVCTPEETGKEVALQLPISEPTIARAFHDYFEDVWEQITPQHKDKRSIIQWLEQGMSLLN